MTAFVSYGQLLATMSAASCQYTTAISGSHSLKETVFVTTLALRRLESTFHNLLKCVIVPNPWAGVINS